MTIKRFNLDEGHIWEAIEGLSPYKTTMTLEGVVEKLNSLCEENEQLRKELDDCEKFRYTVFKRLNDEYIKERSIK